jgi:hypothetical protein
MQTAPDYSIGVVTYVERFPKLFKQLAVDLTKYFPDVERNAIVNGFNPDRAKQLRYLRAVTPFLQDCGFRHVLTFEEHQPLAKCWNLLCILSSMPKILLLNDDVTVGESFRAEFETQRGAADFLLLNGTFSHFMISKTVMKRIGWFDERFTGIGAEDGDCARRAASVGFPYDKAVFCPSLRNQQPAEQEVGFTSTQTARHGNYASGNDAFFRRKWHEVKKPKKGYAPLSANHIVALVGQGDRGYVSSADFRSLKQQVEHGGGKCLTYVKLRWGMQTPVFYPFDILDSTEASQDTATCSRERATPPPQGMQFAHLASKSVRKVVDRLLSRR